MPECSISSTSNRFADRSGVLVFDFLGDDPGDRRLAVLALPSGRSGPAFSAEVLSVPQHGTAYAPMFGLAHC
ncbi:MAG: hypothetical protein ACLFNI_05750 [Natronomonas sp.]